MKAAQTPQSNDCRMASFTWNLAPSIDAGGARSGFPEALGFGAAAKPGAHYGYGHGGRAGQFDHL